MKPLRIVARIVFALIVLIIVWQFRAGILAWFGWKAEPAATSASVPADPHAGHAMQNAATQPSPAKGERKILYWHDPMHPSYRSDKPGIAPDCGMQLVPVYDETVTVVLQGPPGTVRLTQEKQQLIGVKLGKVESRSIDKSVRAVAKIAFDESRIVHVHTKVDGWIEKIFADYVGATVRHGQPLFTLYSPELLALQNDYIAATKAGYKDLAASARKRMKLLGVDDKVLATLAKTGKAYDSVPFYVPADGILNRLEIRKGHYLTVNAEIGHVQDLSTVWVEAAIPEKDLSTIKEGDKAKVVVGNTTELEATVDYIYPTITSETRTGKVRLVVANPDYLLKPAGYATVIFATGAGETLTVSSSAILRDSSGEHVIVALGGGKFQARAVKTGLASEGRTEITSGLSGDEEVVVNGQFLIDSESNLRE